MGAASSLLLAQNAYDLVLHYHSEEAEAQMVAKECEAQGVKVQLLQADMANSSAIEKLTTQAIAAFGRIDLVVYAVGVTKAASYQDLTALSLEDFNHMFMINCTAFYQLAALLKEALMKTNGSIIAISSAAGITGIGSSIAYSASKGALNTLVLSLAKALAPEVRVNAIAPSFIDSFWWSKKFKDKPEQYEGFKQQMIDKTALGKVVMPVDVARCVLYLAESSITGEIIRLDAGAHLK